MLGVKENKKKKNDKYAVWELNLSVTPAQRQNKVIRDDILRNDLIKAFEYVFMYIMVKQIREKYAKNYVWSIRVR